MFVYDAVSLFCYTLVLFYKRKSEVGGVFRGDAEEGGVVHSCLAVSRVGNRSDYCKGGVIDECRLCDSTALHLSGVGCEIGNNSILVGA